MKFRQKQLSLMISTLLTVGLAHGADPAEMATSDAGTVSIVGAGDSLGNGYMQQEDSPKARSSVTRSSIDKASATNNPFQLIELLPGVNTMSHDATGLFGGGLTIRGFNSDQIGFTVNGAPVNDSGNFAVYPQEYVDQENMCELFVTQGSADTDSPHVGATGGNVGIVSCAPEDKAGGRMTQTVGSNNLTKTFLRADTGRMGAFKGYVSYSKAQVDKFRGEGKADREHVDAAFELDLAPGNKISASLLYNNAINNNYRSISLAQYNAFGRDFDYFPTWGGNPTPGAGAQTAVYSSSNAAVTPTAANSPYYGLALNPFKNLLLTAKGNFQINEKTRVDVEPYFWYGYGTGGVQQTLLTESNAFLNTSTTTATNRQTAGKDINGDGDTADRVLIYRGSVTKTYRPGITLRLTEQVDNHKLMAGLWYERARHRQTAPGTTISASGDPADIWLQSNLITRADGTTYENRDVYTISTAKEVFFQDSISLLQDKANVTVGVRRPEIKRDFWNYASEGVSNTTTANSSVNYDVHKTYAKTLPSLGGRYQLSETDHVFANVAQTFKAPGNFSYFNLWNSTLGKLNDITIKPEEATNLDMGYRYQGGSYSFSATAFYTDYKERIGKGYDPVTNLNPEMNIGPATLYGLELEFGTAPVKGWSMYGSLSYTASKVQDDMVLSSTNTQKTSGKDAAMTPRWLAGLSVQYASGPFYVQGKAKYTGKQYTTLVNDESLPGVTIFDLSAGYRLGDTDFFKKPTLRLNITNLFDKSYLTPNMASGSSLVTNATGTGAGTVLYYVGAPRAVSLALSAEF
ncbi:MAG: TonB-dependent receptor [Zoogloea sp.]|uniref:TonB-dependent receptor n=1 Tax=Zoogloea sp. TaxID=49181 RepID=UPI003F3BD8CA